MDYDDLFTNDFLKDNLNEIDNEKYNELNYQNNLKNNDDYIYNDNSMRILIEKDDLKKLRKRKSELETLLEIRKLEKIKMILGDSDPKITEDSYYSKYECFTEKSKIELEAKFLKSKLEKNKKLYESNPKYYFNLTILNIIIDTIDSISSKEYSKVKQCLILMELEFNLDIALVSEVENVYKLKLKKLDDQRKKNKEL